MGTYASRPLTMAMILLRSSGESRPQRSIRASSSAELASDSASSCVGTGVFPERYRGGSSPRRPKARRAFADPFASLFQFACVATTAIREAL